MIRNKFLLVFLFYSVKIGFSQEIHNEEFYYRAYDEIVSMLEKDSLDIKRAVFLAEWAYYDGELDYQKDFCQEIDRIVQYLELFYSTNNLSEYKTGKMMTLNEYFFNPYSGNNYTPYYYDFDSFSKENEPFTNQFVSKVLKSHLGQCRSLPWLYKILAKEIDAEVSIAHAPRHSYIIYRDDDNFTPEDFINLELTTHAMNPTWWIKEHYEISDSAVVVGTYMTPLSDLQTVACQLADLSFGYHEKFRKYDDFTFYCASKSLEYYPQNPNAIIIKAKSLEEEIKRQLMLTCNFNNDYIIYLSKMLDDCKYRLQKTFMTYENDEIRQERLLEIENARIYTNEILKKK